MKIKKHPIAITMFAVSSLSALAADFPIEAKTSDGATVNLYEDGTWRPKTLKVDHEIIRKDNFATSRYQGRHGSFDFYYDPKLWELSTKTDSDSDAEAFFAYKMAKNEASCQIISERIQMDQNALVSSVIQNAREFASNTKMAQQIKSYVNGLRGDIVEFEASAEGYSFSFLSYVTSGSRGTVQLHCWTTQNLIDEYRPIFMNFYGGFFLK